MSENLEHAFAIVEAVDQAGLRLKFDGEETAGEKLYKCNTFFEFKSGDRVYCVKDSGTFVAICKIGAPAQKITISEAAHAASADTATVADTAKSVENATSVTDAGNTTSEDYVVKLRYDRYRKIYEINSSQNGSVWQPLAAPLDEAQTQTSYSEVYTVHFRSTASGGLEYCVPYRNAYTWHTISTT